MKQFKLDTATVTQLVEHFIELSVNQDKALLRENVREFNQLFNRLEDVEHALKVRENDQRRVLIPLYDHPNMQVQLNAAKATLAVSPKAAREALEAIRVSKWMPQSMDAGMCLRNLDQGIFKPT